MGIVLVIVISVVAASATLSVVRAVSCARLNRYFRSFAPAVEDVVSVIDGRPIDDLARHDAPASEGSGRRVVA
ncbi:MAG: hypothetical protein JWL73_3697 [Actinomycetia bacterium]|nr:hypothetical protein [Actinomycetes bacterium]